MNSLKKMSASLILFICSCVLPVSAAFEPVVSMDTSGHLVAIWQEFVSECPELRANTRLTGGSWSGTPDEIVPPDCSLGTYRVATIASGFLGTDTAAVIAWVGYNISLEKNCLFTVMRSSAAGSWTSATQVSDNNENVSDPDFILSISPSGLVSLIWKSNDGSDKVSYASSTGFTNSWSATTVISD
jgi:hypothetical protein